MSLITVNSQLALSSTQATITQSTDTSTTVSSNTANTLITTQTYNLPSTTSASFLFNNTLIKPSSSITTTLISHTVSSTGNPSISLSAQTNGQVWITITNLASNTMNGILNIAVLIY